MKITLLCCLIAMASYADPVNLGTANIKHVLTWDGNNDDRSDLAGFNVYIRTNLQSSAEKITVTTNQFPATLIPGLTGPRFIYVTAFTMDGLESPPSETVLVSFNAGVPLPPKNFQLFTVLNFLATNSLPVVSTNTPSLP